MKNCACIAEYNPLHTGHLRLISHIRDTLKAERLIVVMSGDFCERGENAVMDKYTRAKHAVYAGADIVIELPAVFATANAEIFATGAMKIIKSLGVADAISFGVESGDAQTYRRAAAAMLNETKEFKQVLKRELETGVSLARAKFNAVKALNLPDLDEALVSSPNNILALEYAKAAIKLGANVELFPFLRENAHNDPVLRKSVTSAQSIRLQLAEGNKRKIKKYLPKFVYADLPETPPDFRVPVTAALMRATAKELARITDCTEGLENRIKALLKDNPEYDALLEKVSTKRYTQARVRRIFLANFLAIDEDLVMRCLKSDLYIKVLAVKESALPLVSEIRQRAKVPVLMRKSDYRALEKTALDCFEKDVTACDLFSIVSGAKQNEYFTLIVPDAEK